MNLNDIGNFVVKYAPTLGLALTSPAGAAVAIANVVASAFGGDIKEPQSLLNKMQSDPELQIKLLQIQRDYDIKCQQIIADMEFKQLDHEEELYKADVQDRESARTANNGNQNNNKRDFMPPVIAVLVIVGFYGSIASIMLVNHNEADRDILYMLLGVLGTAFISIINYYFGSSAGSRDKTISLSNMTRTIKS
jgi:hypothetical protein